MLGPTHKRLFSADLYTGTDNIDDITVINNIDLLNADGIQFFKNIDADALPTFFDGKYGSSKRIYWIVNATGIPGTQAFDIGSWTSKGFTVTTNDDNLNKVGERVIVHTFRKAPKFFDHQIGVTVISEDNTISFAGLGEIGMLLCLDATGEDFYVWHRSLTSSKLLLLNTNAAEATLGALTVDGTDVTLHASEIATPIAVDVMAFAHDASTNGQILCGSYTGNGSTTGPVVTLGWVPKLIWLKRAIGGTGDWYALDTVRGISESGADAVTKLNLRAADVSVNILKLNSTGFQITSSDSNVNTNGDTYIYMAVR